MKGYKTIYTTKATSRIIDGSYNSIYKGRSMNFDELREYVVGDDIKDMDWKASARSQKLLVRQYIAEKKHNIMLVMDAGKILLDDTPEEVFSHVDEMKAVGLDVPQVTELVDELRKCGMQLDPHIITEEACAEALMQLL